MIRRGQRLFCRYYQLFARNSRDRFADDRLGTIILCGIEKVDAETDRLFDQRDRMVRRLRIVTHSQPARPAAAEAGNANFQTGSPESCVFHLFVIQAVSKYSNRSSCSNFGHRNALNYLNNGSNGLTLRIYFGFSNFSDAELMQ